MPTPLSPADHALAATCPVATVHLSCSVKRTVRDHQSDEFRSVEAQVGWTIESPAINVRDDGSPVLTPEVAHALYLLHMPRLYRECYSALAINDVITMPDAKTAIERIEDFYQRARKDTP